MNPARAEGIRSLLKSMAFFSGLPDEALGSLLATGQIRRFAKGDVICRRGERGDSLMVLLSGRIKVSNATVDGKEVVLNFLGVGDVNGEIAALDGQKRSADATALEPCEVFAVQSRDLLPVLMAQPAAILGIVRILCQKLRAASAIIEDSTLEMRSRAARGLLRLTDQHGHMGADGVHLHLTLTQSELGGYLGISRENVSRQLAHLRDANVIKIKGTQIVITDGDGLALIAGATQDNGT